MFTCFSRYRLKIAGDGGMAAIAPAERKKLRTFMFLAVAIDDRRLASAAAVEKPSPATEAIEEVERNNTTKGYLSEATMPK
uniref:Uncharacterized protein n=1 Tax=Leersia perrieri TaxID=77586 RepID=A0A0D9WLQ3_9ORYZ